ncbi:trypsin-like serine protease [Comamonas terrigena]|uniref:trypsin-like serine protease n=1 Tax=Comamonas terrigena TaxID=32013 RepID=UPI00244C29FE|nr:trypsin-like serine protease [Comamonas terrigena]MDH1701069.1 trypsin-like serine protease [Comamonas terrigena]
MSLQETARTEVARTALQRKLADRAFLYHLATGAVSAESLQRANLKREELLLAARSVDPHSPALVKAHAAFNSNRILAIAPSLGGRPSVQQVDPDTPASTDAVPTASATGPCNYNSILNRCERLVYRQGFTEVVAVGQRVAGQPVGTIHCTGTMLKDGWLLTAAHCLFDKTGARIAQDKLVVYMPFQGSSEQAMAAQALNRNLRSFSVVPGSATLYDVEFQPSKLYDFESAKDLAVLRVSVPTGSATWRPVVLRTANKDMPFTSAGYGLTNAADPGVDGSTLEITRRTADVQVFPKYLLYESVSTKGMGRVCVGDSGGPVFAGELNGGPKPPEHELVGVVSGSTATGQSVAYCRAGNQYIVRVNTTEVAQWMCSSTKKAICY